MVLSGPSGSGKTTIVHRLCQLEPLIRLSVSATTRPARKNEVDGVDYHFLSDAAFESHVLSGNFVEHATYGGHRYGTLRSEIDTALQQQTDVLLEIDVQGAKQVLQHYPDCVSIWILPPSWESLEHRLRQRQTESEEKILSRLQRAREEFRSMGLYRYVVPNEEGKLADTVDRIRCIRVAEHCRSDLMSLDAIRKEFGGELDA